MNLKIVTRVGVGLCDALAEWTITKQDTVTIGPNIGTKMIPTPIKKNKKNGHRCSTWNQAKHLVSRFSRPYKGWRTGV